MTGPDEQSVHSDLDEILRALVKEREVADQLGLKVLAWLRDNDGVVGEHAHAYMAAMAVRDALEAFASGVATPKDPAMVARYQEVPVSERTAVALHLLAQHPIAETAELVRRPAHEVAGLVADFLAPRTANHDDGATADEGSGDDGSGRRTHRRTSKRARRQPTILSSAQPRQMPKIPPAVRPGFLIALAVLLAVVAAVYLGMRLFGGSDSTAGGSSDAQVALLRKSDGCSAATGDDALDDESISVDVAGTARTARVVAPPPLPDMLRGLVIDLGDVGQTTDAHLSSSQIRTMPVTTPTIVATLLPADGVPQWNVAAVSDEPDDVGAVVATIASVGSRLCLDLAKVHLVGLGAGGHLAGLTVCRHPEAFAGVAMLAGFYRPDDCPTTGDASALVVVSPTDDVFPTEGGTGPTLSAQVGDPSGLRPGANYALPPLAAMISSWAEQAGCGPVAEEELGGLPAKVYSGCSGDSTLVLLTAAETGHGWPQSAVPALAGFVS